MFWMVVARQKEFSLFDFLINKFKSFNFLTTKIDFRTGRVVEGT